MVELAKEEFEAAEARGAARLCGPRAESAHYDAGRNRVIVRLTTSVELGFAPRDAEGLQHASADNLKVIEVEDFGLGMHFRSSTPTSTCRRCCKVRWAPSGGWQRSSGRPVDGPAAPQERRVT